MLVLSRKKQQSIVIGDHITITVLHCGGNAIRLGITAPADVKVVRSEILADTTGGSIVQDEECHSTPALRPGANVAVEKQGSEYWQGCEGQCEMTLIP